MTFTDVGRLDADVDAADVALAMNEDAFRLFYDRTAPALLAYLCRLAGSRHAADDILQEAYYRILRSTHPFEDDAHRKNYLFRVATNLAHDARRGVAARTLQQDHAPADPSVAAHAETRAELRSAMSRLKPRERALLWLAYAEGSSHGEIATILGVRQSSIKVLLFRARTKLARLLGPRVGRTEGR